MHTTTRRFFRACARSILALLALAFLPLLAPSSARAASYTVTALADSGAGSLRQAILNANATAGTDTISFGLSGTVVLASTLPAIGDDLTIDGTGQTIAISGNNAVRVLVVNAGATLDLRHLTVANGFVAGSNAVGSGGGIFNSGVLNITDTIVSGNHAEEDGGGIINDVNATMAITNSTISGNSAGDSAGGIGNDDNATMAITNSTISDNSAGLAGGGIFNDDNATMAITNSTISDNSAGTLAGGIANDNNATLTVTNSTISGNSAANAGGGIVTTSALILANTIVANSPTGGDCFNAGGTISATGVNLVEDGTCAVAGALSGDPKLGPLQDNGGPTLTHALLPGSPAIDAADDAICAAAPVNNLDQRGISRPQAGHCDIGAFELLQDSTPPIITPNVTGTLGNNGWYTSDVQVTWSVSDAESAITSQSGCDPVTLSADTPASGTTFTCAATSAGGSGGQSVTIKRDATAPTLAPSVSPNPVLLGGSATASPNASDALSGIASASCGALNTSSVGTKSVTCTASDNAGNTSNATVNYSVIYAWAGFFQPVDNLPTLNSVKAGQAIPIKFSLGGDFGLNIFAAGYPISQQVACSSGAPIDDIEQTVTAGASSLSYDPTSGQYTYVWKTQKSWANTCRQLVVRLVDGTDHLANFRFK